MKTLVVALILILSGCASSADKGNASYEVSCPVFVGEDQVAATYVNEKGQIQPVMATFKVESGRQLAGMTEAKVFGCFELKSEAGLAQGEDRSGGLTHGLGELIIQAVEILF